MKKHSLKDWMIAVRPWSFPASSMPVVVPLAYLNWMRQDINGAGPSCTCCCLIIATLWMDGICS